MKAAFTLALISWTMLSPAGFNDYCVEGQPMQLCEFDEGSWSIASGPSLDPGQFDDLADPFTTFLANGGPGRYVLEWHSADLDCDPCVQTTVITVYDHVRTPVLGTKYQEHQPHNLRDFKIRESRRFGERFYFVGSGPAHNLSIRAGFPYGLYCLENEQVRFLMHLERELSPPEYGKPADTDFEGLSIQKAGNRVIVFNDERTYVYDEGLEHTWVQDDVMTTASYHVVFPEYNGRLMTSSHSYDGITSAGYGTNVQFIAVANNQAVMHQNGQYYVGDSTLDGSTPLLPEAYVGDTSYLGHTDSGLLFLVKLEGDTQRLVFSVSYSDFSVTAIKTFDPPYSNFYGRQLDNKVLLSMLETESMWVFDGTAKGFEALTAVAPDKQQPSVIGESGVFVIRANLMYWGTDGTAAGTTKLAIPSSSRLYSNELGVFAANGTSVYHFNGTTLATQTLAEGSTVYGTTHNKIVLSQDNAIVTLGQLTDQPTTVMEPLGRVFIFPGDTAMVGDRFMYRTQGLVDWIFFETLPLSSFTEPNASPEPLVSTDGTIAGTFSIPETVGREANFEVDFKDGLALFAFSNENGSHDLYRNDGTETGSELLGENRFIDGLNSLWLLNNGYVFKHDTNAGPEDDRGVLFSVTEGGLVNLGLQDAIWLYEDPFDDALFFRVGNDLHRTDGSVQGTQRILEGGSPQSVVMTENYLFVAEFNFNHKILRRDTWELVATLATNQVDFEHAVILGDSLISEAAGAVTRLKNDGNLTVLFDSEPSTEVIAFGAGAVFATKDSLYTVASNGQLAREPFPVTFDFLPQLTTFGEQAVFISGIDPMHGREGYIATETGVEPLREFVEGPNYGVLMAAGGRENRLHLVYNDPEYDSAVYVLDLNGPNIPDSALRQYLLGLYDLNLDGKLDWDEALAVTVIDLRDNYNQQQGKAATQTQGVIGVRSLEGIQGFANLEALYLAGNHITDLTPVVSTPIGSEGHHVLDLEHAGLDSASCTALSTLLDRTSLSGASLSFSQQGGNVLRFAPQSWPQESILTMILDNFIPAYTWDCVP